MYSWPMIFESYAPLLLGGLAWGLLWSSLSKNTLLAAVLAVVSVSMSWLLTTRNSTEALSWRQDWEIKSRLLLPSLALGASLVALAWRPSWGWLMLWNRSITISRPSRPIAIRSSSTSRSLFWQVVREGWPTALLVALMSLLLPGLSVFFEFREEGMLPLLLATLAALMAGVSVFGSWNQGGSRRFLVHHGVTAGAVWWRRVLAWGLFLAILLGLMIESIRVIGAVRSPVGPLGKSLFPGYSVVTEGSLLMTFAIFNAFAIGIVCGMTIRRGITAGLVGLMTLVVLIPFQFGLAALEMIPIASLVLIPSLLIAISAAWAGDWFVEPEGFGRWLRLAWLVVVPFGLVAAIYTGYRGFGVADLPPVAIAPDEFLAVPDDQNAATLYRRAIEQIGTTQRGQLSEANTAAGSLANAVDFWKPPDLTAITSALPRLAFESPDRMILGSTDWELYRDLQALDLLLALEARERLKHVHLRPANLAGAWEDILAQFRMANQLVETTPTIQATWISTKIHARAANQAFYWLADDGQTRETLRKALADLKTIPELPGMSRCLRFESLLIERACDLSTDELAERLFQLQGRRSVSPIEILGTSWLITPAWERQRARRVCRAIIAGDLPLVAADPWERGAFLLAPYRHDRQYQGSPLVKLILQPIQYQVEALDKERVNRRALDQMAALILWRLEHVGKDADKLEDLVPGLLAKLPVDPYSGRPFGYVENSVVVLDFPSHPENHLPPTHQWINENIHLLYSVGPDLKDDLGRKSVGSNPPSNLGDLIFAIP
jgi:hypothetical protein